MEIQTNQDEVVSELREEKTKVKEQFMVQSMQGYPLCSGSA